MVPFGGVPNLFTLSLQKFAFVPKLSFNPLWTEFFFFRRFSGHKPKIGSFRLPTHRRDAHRKFFDDPFLK